MTREEAIKIIRQEYKCVDAECDIERNCGKCDYHMPSKEPILKAYEMAIQALSQEPCTDAVSRQAVLDEIDATNRRGGFGCKLSYTRCRGHVDQLPSVTQKSGKWIPVSERLPEDEQGILFSTKTGRVHSGKYHDDDSANQWYSHSDKCRAWNNVVSAWMPLPKPYEPQESDEISDRNMKMWEELFKAESEKV